MASKRITLNFHIGGTIRLGSMVRYHGGRVVKFADVDVDMLGWFTLMAFAKDSGFEVSRLWYCVPGHSLTRGLREITCDAEVFDMVLCVEENGSIDVFCEGRNIEVPEERGEGAGAGATAGESDDSWWDDVSFSDAPTEGSKGEERDRTNKTCAEQGRDQLVQNDGEGASKDSNEARGAVGSSPAVSEYENSDADIFSSDDGDDIVGACKMRRIGRFVRYDPECNHKTLEFVIGLSFETHQQFRKAIQDYAILNGYNVRWYRSSRKNAEAKCVDGCPWRVYASWVKKDNMFVVKATEKEHKCSRSLTNRQATRKWLAEELVNMKINFQKATAKEVQQELMAKYTLQVPLMQCYRSGWLANNMMDGSMEEHYRKVRSYVAALRRRYPDSTFELVLDQTGTTGMYTTFKRLYIGFEALRKGFKRIHKDMVKQFK